MESEIHRLFLDFSRRKLRQLADRIADCLSRLSEEQIWSRGGRHQNAAGNLVLHLCGNVRQWIGHGAGGLPDIRARDAEFAAHGGLSRTELIERLDAVLREADAILEGLTPQRLRESVTIQGYRVTVLEAVYHAVEHFSQHTGQIIFITKWLTGEDLGYYRHLSGPAPSPDPTP